MCQKCRNFTNAPVGQKRRRCSYCGSIIDISKAAVVLLDDHTQASDAVKKFNASRGGDEFEKAVERSRERIREIVPKRKLQFTDIEEEESDIPTGKRARLLGILEEHAKEKPLSLDELEALAEKAHLDWSWVEKQLTTMANGGVMIFPRPWTVKLVKMPDKKEDASVITRDVSKDILVMLRRQEDGLSIESIVLHFKDLGIASDSVMHSLEKLMSAGEIYEPKQGFISSI